MTSETLWTLVTAAVSKLGDAQGWDLPEMPAFDVSRTKDERFGDWSVNVAMMLAKPLGKNPMEIAEAIKEQITRNGEHEGAKVLEKIEIVKPGYINFFLSPSYLAAVLGEALEKGERFGESEMGKGKKVNNEFISANPTGPLSVGNARGGFYADTLARVLNKAGYAVTNEYYVNDAGEQILALGHSVLKDEAAVYKGEYIEALHARIGAGQRGKERDVGTAQATGEWAAQIILEEMIQRTTREKMGIVFEAYVSEKTDIVAAGYSERALAMFADQGLSYRSADRALWLRTTEFGDDKDRVLVKHDGMKTYFASDCGYLLHKMERGFSYFVLTLGADHHGYVRRLQAAARALGFTGELRFILMQLVKVMRAGKEVRMSKRVGNLITIEELIEAVGRDVARFFFLMYAPETHMNFDLGLATERSRKNPVYYVQYAYARLSSVLRKAEAEGWVRSHANLSLLADSKERELIRELLFFPEMLQTIAEDFGVHRLPTYALRLADRFHAFYDACRVLDAANRDLSAARLELMRATRIVLGETFRLMGIAAPQKM